MEALRLKKSIEKLLDGHTNGRYLVNNPQRRKTDAESIFLMPQVTVFYAAGDFNKSKSSVNGPYHQDASFNIHVSAGTKTKVNLAVLRDLASTPEQLASAIAETDNAMMLLDEKIDDLLSLLFDIIMRPENRNLGADYITNRWVSRISKHDPEPMGAIITGAATITLTAQCSEEVTSEEGVPAGNGAVDTVLEFGGKSKQGAIA